MTPKRRSQNTEETVVSEIAENTKPIYNIAIIGTISSGKSTLLNAIFGKTYSQMKIRRTTMIPSQYKLSQIDQADLSAIQETNNKLNEKYAGDTLWDGKEVPTFVVPTPEKFNKLSRYLDISIYDIPGLNDQKTKDIYYNWVRDNTQNFDIIYLLFDINSGLNTSDELELLQLVCGMMSANKRLKTIILGNKCDSLVVIPDGSYKMDDEHLDIFEKQMVSTINLEMKSHTISNDRFKIIPFCSRLIYIYRTLHNLNVQEKANIISVLKNTDNFEELNELGYLNFKHLEEIVIDDVGRIKWNRMTHEQKVKRLEKMLAINAKPDENDEVIEMAGGNLLFELTNKFMDKNELINNILFRVFSHSEPFDNINEMKNIKNIKISKKSNKNRDFQKQLIQQAIDNLYIDDIYFKYDNIDVWSIMLIDIHEILQQYDLHIRDCKIIFERGRKALDKYIEQSYEHILSNLSDDLIFERIPAILDPYLQIVEILMTESKTVKEAIYKIQEKLYDIYITIIQNFVKKHRVISLEFAIMLKASINFSLEHSLKTDIFLKIYDSIIEDGGNVNIVGILSGQCNTYRYLLETLKYINKEFKNNIGIKSRIICIKNRIYEQSFNNVPAQTLTIAQTTRILRLVYDFENNNYYKILMKTIIEGNDTDNSDANIEKEAVEQQVNTHKLPTTPLHQLEIVNEDNYQANITPETKNPIEKPLRLSVEKSTVPPNFVGRVLHHEGTRETKTITKLKFQEPQPSTASSHLKQATQSDFQKAISVAMKKPNFNRYKDALLHIVTRSRDNYHIYQFISPFMSNLFGTSFRYFYEALQQPQRRCDWESFIHTAVSDAENGNDDITKIVELIINKF